MGSLISREVVDDNGDDADDLPTYASDADVMHRIVDQMRSESCGDAGSEPAACCAAISRGFKVLKASLYHDINDDVNQFAADAANDVVPQTNREAMRVRQWVDEVLTVAAMFNEELDCPITVYEAEKEWRRNQKRSRRHSQSTVPASSYIASDRGIDHSAAAALDDPHRTKIAAVAAIAMARAQRHGPSHGGAVIPESEDDEVRSQQPASPSQDVRISRRRSRSGHGDDGISDGSVSLRHSASGVSSPMYPSTTTGELRPTDVLSRAFHLHQQRKMRKQARAHHQRRRRGSMSRSASAVTVTTESSAGSSVDVFELGTADDVTPAEEHQFAVSSPREGHSSNISLTNLESLTRRPPRPLSSSKHRHQDTPLSHHVRAPSGPRRRAAAATADAAAAVSDAAPSPPAVIDTS